MISMVLLRSSLALTQMHKDRLELVLADSVDFTDLARLVVAKQTSLNNYLEVLLEVPSEGEVVAGLLVLGKVSEEVILKQVWESVFWRLAKAQFGTSLSPQW